MSFVADFIINGNGAYANEKIDFTDNSSIGAVVDSDSLVTEGVDKSELTLSDYTVTKITKYQWHFGDGNFYYDSAVSHKFSEPGNIQVRLSVWSESFIHAGQTFYFKYTITKEVTVQSRFYKFLIDNYPTWELVKNPQLDAIFTVAGKFFDKLHGKIADIYNLFNAEKVSPEYFELLAQTLGHESYYRKVGYTLEQGDLSKYDIIDRIAAGIASDDEINSFRGFLSKSAQIFKKKGTPQDVIKFLEFFSVDGEPVDLWTLNFGKTTKGSTEESFTSDSFDNNKLSLSWDNVKILGNVNDLGHLVKNDGSITIDSYYKVQKYEQDADVFTLAPVINRKNPDWDIYELPRYVKEVRYGDDEFFTPVEMWMTPNEISNLIGELYVTTPWQSLDLEAEQQRIVFDDRAQHSNQIIKESGCATTESVTSQDIKYIHSWIIRDIRLNNGSEIKNFIENNDINPYLVDWRSNLPSGGSIVVDVSALPLEGYFDYYPYLQVQNFLEANHVLEQGQRMSISYLIANEDAVESSIVAKDDLIKDFDATATFTFGEPEKLTYNAKTPDNQVHIIFRGAKTDEKEKFAITQYYKATVCARDSTFSVSKVTTNSDGSIVQQKFNLTGDRDNIIFDSIIFDGSEKFAFEYNFLYELKISVTGSLISAWMRRLTDETKMVNDISIGLGNNDFGKNIEGDEWVLLVENLDLDASQENVTSYNIKNQVINNMSYTYYGDAGSIGFGCKNTILNVTKLVINNRDLDTTLYTPVEKNVRLKPKYLEWQRQRDIILSSYDNTIPYFDEILTKNFSPAKTTYQLSNEQASSVQSLYFNKIQVNDKLATRYTVWFDKQWLQDNYLNEGRLDSSFYDKITIPLGSQKYPFVSENTVYNYDMYKDSLGNVTGAVGLFIANNSPIFGEYETKPEDEFSSLTRSGSGYGNVLYTNERLAQYKLSGRTPGFIGVYEEIFPLSNYFPELDGKLVLNDQSIFRNQFFNPVIVDTECGKRVIGVRFRNCKDILTTIKTYSTELQKEIYIYGSFTFHVPAYAVKHAPNKDFEVSELYNDYVKYNVFLPLGILNEHIKTYTLSKPYLKEFGGMMIKLNGIYVRLSQDQVQYSNSAGSITLKNLNQYENEYNELACRYWLAANIDLHSTVYRDTEPDFTSNADGINFFFHEDSRKLLTSMEALTSSYDASGDYRWWLPLPNDDIWSGVYRKRDFDIITVDLINDLTTNLNYFGYDATPMVECQDQRDRAALKVLFGNKIGGFTFSKEASLTPYTQCITASDPLKALQLRLTDGDKLNPIQANATYYAKITVKINYSGFDQEDVDILTENERMKLKILGTTKKEKFKKAPVVKCYSLYIPFAWYDADHKPESNIIQYADYIRGAYGHGDVPAITFSPIGLMTELINKMDAVDKANVLNSGIDFSTWNKHLLDNMSIDAVYEPIPTSVCKLYKDYGIFNKIDLNVGSYVEINYNKSDQISWDVIEQFRYFFDGTKENFFSLPNQINTMRSWVENVREVTLNNYVVDQSLYTISDTNVLTLSSDSSYQYLTGADMVSKHMLNLYLDVFNTSQNNFTYEEFTQNFNTFNQITFVPYEATSITPYKVVERTPSESLIFDSTDILYDVINVGGYQAMRVNMDNTQLNTAHGKVGSANTIKDINLNLSEMPDIQKLFIIDEDSPVFDMETLVYFDEKLDKIGDYRGKKFEFIIKANNTFSSKTNTYNLSEYYFVGIGTYDFDVGLGIAKYDASSDTLKKSFLVGFGDYNTKNIKSNTWYKLRVIATKDYIRVIFNERDESERLVINYNISPKNSDISGINSGNYEEMVYLVKGLNNLDITYLDKIGTKTGSDFVNGNVDTELASSKRPAGYMAGFAVHNQYTYVTNIIYRVQKPKLRNFSNVTDCTDVSTFLTYIRQNFAEFEDVKYVGKTINNTLVVQVDDILYYSDSNRKPVKFIEKDVIETVVHQKYVVVSTKLNNAANIIVVPETFKDSYNVFLKDNHFNVDHIYRYLAFTDRVIDKVYVDGGQISIVLKS